jgi:NAD(P)-dependent dehydrogenase (short-subunit alcohol dehydrogenase family)
VDRYLDQVFERTGAIDLSFSAVGIANTVLQGAPLVELSVEHFMAPVETYVRSHFVTARLAARRMISRKSGVILTITSIPARVGTPLVGGMATAWGGVEALTRTLSAELGPHGIRVLCIRTHGMPETATIHEVFGIHARAHGITPAQFHDRVATQQSHLGRLPKLTELGDVAAFLASDRAAAMTGTVVNLTSGGVAD